MKMILKSSSPRRYELLKAMGYDFIVKAYDVDETMDINMNPYENVKNIAIKKGLAHKDEYEDYIQISCDTIVVFNNKIYGKPKDENDAYNMLKEFSGNIHQVMSGLCVIYNDKMYTDVVISEVKFKKLSDEDIKNYIATKEVFGKAGAYAIQGIGRGLVEYYNGSLNNIIGLPTEALSEILKEIENV